MSGFSSKINLTASIGPYRDARWRIVNPWLFQVLNQIKIFVNRKNFYCTWSFVLSKRSFTVMRSVFTLISYSLTKNWIISSFFFVASAALARWRNIYVNKSFFVCCESPKCLESIPFNWVYKTIIIIIMIIMLQN